MILCGFQAPQKHEKLINCNQFRETCNLFLELTGLAAGEGYRVMLLL